MLPTQQPISGPNARLSALTALVHTLDKRKPLDAAWAVDRHFEGMSPSDRGFAQLLAKTTMRRLGQIDDLLARFLERPLPPSASRVMHALRLGVVQLIWLETPPHAAVHATVDVAKQLKLDKFTGLVNAVLKRVAQDGKGIIATQDENTLNTPEWLRKRWEKTYGKDLARQIAAAHLKEAPLDISVKENAALWAEKLSGVLLPTGSVRLAEARNLTQLPGFAEGAWWVQDTAASLPAKLLGDVKNKRVIDLCAAPGGKTAQLAAAGAQVSAVDLSRDRLAMLKTNVHRLKLQASYVTGDATTWTPSAVPEAILLDAPCSATGTLRRHPDVAWLRSEDDIPRLVEMQRKLLANALDMLKPGGHMVYAVCSLQPEEGDDQITQLLKSRKDVKLQPIDAGMIGGMKECITARGELRTLPCHLDTLGGMDGFYAARLVKEGA